MTDPTSSTLPTVDNVDNTTVLVNGLRASADRLLAEHRAAVGAGPKVRVHS